MLGPEPDVMFGPEPDRMPLEASGSATQRFKLSVPGAIAGAFLVTAIAFGAAAVRPATTPRRAAIGRHGAGRRDDDPEPRRERLRARSLHRRGRYRRRGRSRARRSQARRGNVRREARLTRRAQGAEAWRYDRGAPSRAEDPAKIAALELTVLVRRRQGQARLERL